METLNGKASQSKDARTVDFSLHGAIGWADFPKAGFASLNRKKMAEREKFRDTGVTVDRHLAKLDLFSVSLGIKLILFGIKIIPRY